MQKPTASIRPLVVVVALIAVAAFPGVSAGDTTPTPAYWSWAPTPPMGWNSWDSFATTITEDQAKAETDYMADHLLSHGWQYLVVDIQWYEPGATGFDYRKDARLTMDANGRLLPAPNRFPSAANGGGFKALSDYVHAKGLKFGVHMLRGIPRQAVAQNTPILGTTYHAADIADTTSICHWNGDMYGVDMTKPGAQDYYDSEFRQFADWGIDFVKIDDLSAGPYHGPEVQAIRKAIDKTGRVMVFSASPGPTPLEKADEIEVNANLWRISDDFWDNWKSLLHQVDLTAKWSPYSGPGHFPDADMLPLGMIRQGKSMTHFTHDEQVTLMTLWSIFRSPLIFGGDLTKMDATTLALITNDEVLAVDQHSANNQQLFRHDGQLAWVADVPDSTDKYLAVFNLNDKNSIGVGAPIDVKLSDLGFTGVCKIRDLWQNKDLAHVMGTFAPVLPSHGAGLYRIACTD